ncbi:MAG TPA: hypothetical protein PKZ12_06125 [Smithellaceae bacterium]|nr:hypothetical protein [Smithellaceae bacterium]
MIDESNKAKITVHLSDGATIKGTLNINRYNRPADFLNSSDTSSFLAIYDTDLPAAREKVVIINREHIVWAYPEE